MEQPFIHDEKIDLIRLCDKDPAIANDMVQNASRYSATHKKTLCGIPACLCITRPLTCTQLNKVVRAAGCIIKTYPVLFKNVISEQTCLKCNETSAMTEQELAKIKGSPHCLSCGSQCLKTLQRFEESFPIQKIRIQDMSNHGAMSETIEICVEGKMAGVYLPGDKIAVTGVVLRRWNPLRINEPMISTIYIKALQIIKEEDEEDGYSEMRHLIEAYTAKSIDERRSFIIGSFCPELYGLANVKLGLLLALVGGTAEETGATRINSHVLLVGDPGTGKSHLLKNASKLLAPSVFTNGVGTSDAGLTSCAVRSGREWVLEAGALVLADTGICCIDEFNRLKINEKSGLLESMEQQTVSVAKAGIVTTLNSRCSVLAVAGTRYNYDLKASICENLKISSPLVSRFDLIFGLFEKGMGNSRDKEVVDKIFTRESPQKYPEHVKWSQCVIKAYLVHCRKKKNKITDAASQVLLKYYTKKKTMVGVNEYNTIRMLESLVRLAEAHSKLMNEESVTVLDAFTVILLMETCIGQAQQSAIEIENVFAGGRCFEDAVEAVKRKFQIELG